MECNDCNSNCKTIFIATKDPDKKGDIIECYCWASKKVIRCKVIGIIEGDK